MPARRRSARRFSSAAKPFLHDYHPVSGSWAKLCLDSGQRSLLCRRDLIIIWLVISSHSGL